MPEFIEPEHRATAFEDHPCASLFIELAFREQDSNGGVTIPKGMQKQVAAEFGISESEAAALAYLAGKRVQDISEEIDYFAKISSRGWTQ
jgi:hypothetical protein